ILEGGSASSLARRLVLLAVLGNLFHLLEDVLRLARPALIGGFRKNPVPRHAAMAVAVTHVSEREDVDVALAVDGAGLDENVLRLRAVGAAVHPQRAADGARDAAIECEARNAGVSRRAGHLHIRHGGAGAERSEEHTSELQSRENPVCRLLLEKKKGS